MVVIIINCEGNDDGVGSDGNGDVAVATYTRSPSYRHLKHRRWCVWTCTIALRQDKLPDLTYVLSDFQINPWNRSRTYPGVFAA